jgi:hypothetical protein
MPNVARGVGGLDPSAAAAFAAAYYGGALEAVELSPTGTTWTEALAMPAAAKLYAGTPLAFLEWPMVPAGVAGASLSAGAAGTYAAQVNQLVSKIVAAGMTARTVVVIGAEFNWSGVGLGAAKGHAADFVSYWNQVATPLKAAGIKTCWSISVGQTDVDPATCWPDPSLVDYVGGVVYDYKYADGTLTAAQRWTNTLAQTYGLNWLASWAKAKGKPIALTRWGLDLPTDTLTGPGGGGGDNPLFVQNLLDWCKANYVAASLPYQIDVGAIPAVTPGYPLLPAADGAWDPSTWRTTRGSATVATAAKIVGNRAILTSGATGNNAPADRVLAKLIAAGTTAKYEWDVPMVVNFGGGNDIIEAYPGAADFDPATGVAFSTGLQAQVQATGWRLGYRATTGFVTLASGTWSQPVNTDLGWRIVTGPVQTGATAGQQDFSLYFGTAAQEATTPPTLPLISKVTLTAAQRTAAGSAGAFFVQQLGQQSTTAVAPQSTTFAVLDPIPGAT